MKSELPAKPLFSVVIPTFNRPDMLVRAITSVMSQTCDDFEIIVVDDGSDVDVRVADHAGWGKKVIVIRSQCNMGVAHARNTGIRQARGTYVSFLDDDDEFATDFLEKTAAALAYTPTSIGFSWTHVAYVCYSRFGGLTRRREFAGRYADDEDLLCDAAFIGTGFGVTIKRACFERVGCFDASLQFVEDTDFFVRLLAAGFRPVLVDTFGVRVHNHHMRRLTAPEHYPQRLIECDLLMKRHEVFINNHPRVLARFSESTELIRRRMARRLEQGR
ncbi:glycosyltransferase involved in cell wall biosynthesis [Luteibacter sp. Sphag1AF]|uniref:glycosyltransferase family 2 protein n=1 Tax=Luteibacter sp. Sphag1AF TaxID=2587031 RepID=UPI001609FCBD|nr:glycosyltransferase family 2 protein [Luteibacter sp. Sphag1AF]MBB3226442.1 glycosyltransferase involved in cell wall biosynthesis [Luteibacter sp. Sphag1AF]